MVSKYNKTSFQTSIKIFQMIVFAIIQILFSPISIIGIVITGFGTVITGSRDKGKSSELGVSYTAGKVLQYRWVMHYFKSRKDEASVKLVKVIPTESHYGLLCFMSAAIISNRISGYKPILAKIPKQGEETPFNFTNSRTVYFDKVMKDSINEVEQVVILGAGYDLRVLQFTQGKNVKVFELDKENTQTLKTNYLEKAKIAYNWVRFVPVDFNTESWSKKLLEFGFDSTKKTFFLWEGVTVYLEKNIVKQTLKTIHSISPKGSIVALDFYSKSFLTGEGSLFLKMCSRSVKKSGEPWIFGIDSSKNLEDGIEQILQNCGLVLSDCKIMGSAAKKIKPLGAMVTAKIG